MEYLSNIELFYSSNYNDSLIIIEGEENQHLIKVMRHIVGDKIHITDGRGFIYSAEILEIKKNSTVCSIISKNEYINHYKNITFCFTKLKSPERFEFALEKCTELGITNFVIYDSERSMNKGNKLERWNRIVLSAMKQSLRCFLPEIKIDLKLKNLIEYEGNKVVLEQETNKAISNLKMDSDEKYFFIFGPEGGLSKNELSMFTKESLYKLEGNRLRSETAIISTASKLIMLF